MSDDDGFDDDFGGFSDPHSTGQLHSLGAASARPNVGLSSNNWLADTVRTTGHGAAGVGGFASSAVSQPLGASAASSSWRSHPTPSEESKKPRVIARLDAAVAWGRKQQPQRDAEAGAGLGAKSPPRFMSKKGRHASAARGRNPWVSRPTDGSAVRRPSLPWQQLMMNAGNAAYRHKGKDKERRGGGPRARKDGDEVRLG